MRSVEQEYKKLNEQVMPSDALIAKTRERMRTELSADRVAMRMRAQLIKKIASYAAVAAVTAVVCVGVMSARTKGATESIMMDSAMPESVAMESVAEEEMWEESADMEAAAAQEANTREYADTNIYYVQDGEILAHVEEQMDCTVEELISVWAECNGVQDVTVLSVEVQDASGAMGVHIDLSGGLKDQLDAEGLMVASLSMTVGEYLNADGIILTCEGMPL